ncbi:class I SAM-dependent methyltransferase [Saccharopolyspora taberi]|uniref:Methyltransferase domain-containing protein n=1 Tax=Saccharopolyspora taberi TaxID=60895 RepID=A0ABN3VG11_9PSEU
MTTTDHQRRHWDRMSHVLNITNRLFPHDRLARTATRALRLQPGQTVLDIGCGTGPNFPALHDALGPAGKIIAIDHSPGMLAKAHQRIQRHGWTNIELHQADISRENLGTARADAAIAAYAFSAMPDIPAATRNVHTALTPGGALFTYDIRQPDNAGAPLRLTYRLFTRTAGGDVLTALHDTFDTVTHIHRDGTETPPPDNPWHLMALARRHSST